MPKEDQSPLTEFVGFSDLEQQIYLRFQQEHSQHASRLVAFLKPRGIFAETIVSLACSAHHSASKWGGAELLAALEAEPDATIALLAYCRAEWRKLHRGKSSWAKMFLRSPDHSRKLQEFEKWNVTPTLKRLAEDREVGVREKDMRNAVEQLSRAGVLKTRTKANKRKRRA